MRDTERIDRVLSTIRTAWKQVPDWRLGQLLVNAAELRAPCPELFYVEDDRLEHMVARLSEGRTMTRQAFQVAHTDVLEGRGLLIATDQRYADLPPWLALNVGDEIEVRAERGPLRTTVSALEFRQPWTPETPFAFLIPEGIPEEHVTNGSEIWVTESSVVKPAD